MNKVSQNAIELLESEHKEAKKLFHHYEVVKDYASPSEKLGIAKEVCGSLLIHMEIEEKIFYPRVRSKIHDNDLMNEADVEHNSAKALIKQIGELQPSDPMFDAKIKVLGEQIEHHVEEEEGEMFPKARKSTVDLDELGAELLAAKAKMRTDLGLDATTA
jgi:hemerythrin-like domain-containing protein